MKIGINLTSLFPKQIGGMENYVRKIIDYFPLIDNGEHNYVLYINETAFHTFFKSPRIKKIKTPINPPEDFFTNSIKQEKIDFWFCPLIPLTPSNPGLPSAITIPDIQHEYYPKFFEEETLQALKKIFPQSIASADLVLTISKFSKHSIEKKYNCPPNKIKVTYLGTDNIFNNPTNKQQSALIKKKYKLPNKYIFYPANTWPHKNHITLIKAFSKYTEKFDNKVCLILTGAPKQSQQKINDLIKELNLTRNIKHLGFINKTDLPHIYAQAKCLIFPSLFEGFGIPLVEAMKTNCPIICAKNTSIPEIAKDAALYFDPKDPNDICDKLRKLLTNKSLQNKLVQKGQKYADNFSYKNCAQETLNLIQETNKKYCLIHSKKPKITIITPSYNQGQFIEETIKSIVNQNYPNLEYLIIDGGSTDGTQEIIKKYAKQHPFIKWISEIDEGQADAINKGLKMATGQIIGWVNSDDIYYPNTLKKVAEEFIINPKIDFIYGKGMHIDKQGHPISEYPTIPEFDYQKFGNNCFICQPTTFWRKEIMNKKSPGIFTKTTGTKNRTIPCLLDESLYSCLDYEYWIRLTKNRKVKFINEILAGSRMYKDNKSLKEREIMYREMIAIQKKHFNFTPYATFLWQKDFKNNKTDQFFLNQPITNHIKRLAYINFIYNNLRSPQKLLREFKNPSFKKTNKIAQLNISTNLKKLSSNTPKISIITPSFNQEKFIKQTIESVISQNYPNLEYIIIDGGSTDGSQEIIKKYAKQHPCIKWISEKDNGQSAAINKGFKMSTGEIVAWLNSDDTYAPNAIQNAVDFLNKNTDTMLMYADAHIIDEAGNFIQKFPATEEFDYFRLINTWDFIMQPTTFWRRELFEHIGYLNENLHFVMDWDFWIRAAQKFKLKYNKTHIANNREYSNTKTLSGGKKRLTEIRKLIRKYSSQKYPPSYRIYTADTWAQLISGRYPRIGKWFRDKIADKYIRRQVGK